MSRSDSQVNWRIPCDLKEWIDQQAELNRSSKSSELTRAVRERKERVESEQLKAAA